jgi:hypothetical protein
MNSIEVSKTDNTDGWMFEVIVSNGSSTTHKVTLTNEYYTHLGLTNIDPAKLVESSFKFLLEREPKEMILRNFDLRIISNYFSEYETRLSEYI